MPNTIPPITLEKNPNRPRGLYCYDDVPGPEAPASWRPDLVPDILWWLDALDETTAPHLTQLRAGMRGGFIAEFVNQVAGVLTTITIRFDHTYSTIDDGLRMWTQPAVLPYHPSSIHEIPV